MRCELCGTHGKHDYKDQFISDDWLRCQELQSEINVLRQERHLLRVQREFYIQNLMRIHNLLRDDPIFVRESDGATLRYDNPVEAQEMLRELSKRIKAIPEELSKCPEVNTIKKGERQ
jgi:chromosome segregation ATPase